MKVIYTILAVAGWAWFVVAGVYIAARLWNEHRRRGFEVVVNDHEE